MRKDMLTIIKKEFARFFGDKNLFFTTVIMPGLVIYIMYTIMGQGMMKQFMADDTYVADAYVVNLPDELKEEAHNKKRAEALLDDLCLYGTR